MAFNNSYGREREYAAAGRGAGVSGRGAGYEGEYNRDDRYEREEADGALPEPGYVPDVVRTFVVYLYRHIREKNVPEIQTMYEHTFAKLSEQQFERQPWPLVELIAPLVDHDHVFCVLYKEMFFRHLYARLNPTIEQRCESWENYCQLFQVILNENINMQLPNLWLWDMIDEFIYQFQSFCQVRAKLTARSDHELAILRTDTAWNVYAVLNYLQALVDTSGIVAILDEEAAAGGGPFTASDGYGYAASNVRTALGYFALAGLTRAHCLLGDHRTALQKLAPLDLGRPGVMHKVLGCLVTTMFYYGFASLMQRRYVDAIKAFNQVLLTVARTRQFHEDSPAFAQVATKNEQMYALLALALSLCPQGRLVEEGVSAALREKQGERMAKLARGDREAYATYDELFSFACPKFVTPYPPPSFDAPLHNYNQDAYRLQLTMFLDEVRQQLALAEIRTCLKHYTAISLQKLAGLLKTDEASLRTALLTYKHKMHVLEDDGSVTNNSETEFHIDNDMVHVADVKTSRRFGDYFVRHITKFDDIVHELDALPSLG